MSDQIESEGFGIRETERRQGFEPMPMVHPDPPKDLADIPVEEETFGPREAADFVAKRREEAQEAKPSEAEPLTRQYNHQSGPHAGERMPENQTVELDRAARDITGVREAEDAAKITALERELLQQLDQQRPEEIQPPQPPQESAEAPPPDLEGVPPRPEGPAGAQADKLTRLFSENPELLETVEAYRQQSEQQVQAVQQQAVQVAEAARQQYQQVVYQNAQAAAATLVAQFPELAGLSGEQLPIAIQTIARTDPQRAASIQNHIGQVSRLVETARQVQQQQTQTQQQQYQQAFQQAAKQNDDAYNRWITQQEPDAGRRQEITATAKQILRDSGLSDQDISYQWSTSPILRSFAGQQILADAARYRMAQAVAKQKVVRPVPTVQRPGSPVARGSEQDWNLGKLTAKLDRTGSPKDAAAYLTAKRAAARR